MHINLIESDQSASHSEPLDGQAKALLRNGQLFILRRIVWMMLVLGGIAVAAGVQDFVISGESLRLTVIAIVYITFLIVTFLPVKNYAIQAGVLLVLLYGVGVVNLWSAGQAGYSLLILLAVPVLAALFFDRQVGIACTLLVIITVVIFAILYTTGVVYILPEILPGMDEASFWITTGITFVFLVFMMTVPLYDIFRHLTTALSQERQLAHELDQGRTDLEERVAELTGVIARRSRYLEASAIVAREAAGLIDDPDALLRRVVNVISERFGFYHTALFLNDAGGEWAELQAASSEGGQLMLAKGHRLLIGVQGIVGYVAQRGHSRIALNVGEDAVFFDNPHLPETRSEIALPLQVQGKIIGVLDVQSTEKQAFNEDDSAVLQSLADQVALAIGNARLFALSQKSIEAERRLRGEFSLDGWRKLLQTERELSARSRSEGSSSTGEVWYPEMGVAMQASKPVLDSETQKRIAIPVRVAGQTVGVVAARKSPTAGRWSSAEIKLLDSLTDQLNAVVERARLYRQAQHVASRQRTIADVGARLRASLHMETLLQSAANEIRQAMNLSDVEIRLAQPGATPDEENPALDDNGVEL